MEQRQDAKFVGTPNVTTFQEQSKWKKFLLWLLPWVGDKVDSADQYVDNTMRLKEAEVAKAWGEVAKMTAETEKLKMETALIKLEAFEKLKTIAADAQRMEIEKLEAHPIAEKSEEEMASELQILLEQINQLKILYGLEVSVSTRDLQKLPKPN